MNSAFEKMFKTPVILVA